MPYFKRRFRRGGTVRWLQAMNQERTRVSFERPVPYTLEVLVISPSLSEILHGREGQGDLSFLIR